MRTCVGSIAGPPLGRASALATARRDPEITVMVGRHLATRLSPYHRYGPFAGLVAVAKRLSQPWLEWGEIVVVEMPLRSRGAPARSGDLVVKVAEKRDLPVLAAAFGRPLV